MAKRDGLLRMLADCDRGLIDYILVKSISRFSRNTVETVETVRRLSAIGVYIFFEKENIDTGKMEGELMLSIMSSLAEDESRSLSDNNKWSIQKRFQNGTYVIGTPAYGYKNVDCRMVIDEEKAEVVKRIFASVLEGKSGTKIASELQEEGIPTARSMPAGMRRTSSRSSPTKNTSETRFFRRPIRSASSTKSAASMTARCRSTMWKAATKPSSTGRPSSWCRRRSQGGHLFTRAAKNVCTVPSTRFPEMWSVVTAATSTDGSYGPSGTRSPWYGGASAGLQPDRSVPRGQCRRKTCMPRLHPP